jgi:hypothetical protein
LPNEAYFSKGFFWIEFYDVLVTAVREHHFDLWRLTKNLTLMAFVGVPTFLACFLLLPKILEEGNSARR